MINMDFDAYSDVEEMEVEVVEHLKEEQVEEISSVEVREEDSIILNTLLVNANLDIVEGQAQEVAVSYHLLRENIQEQHRDQMPQAIRKVSPMGWKSKEKEDC